MRAWKGYIPIPAIASISRSDVNRVLSRYPRCHVLDLGSGRGRISEFLRDNGFEVLSVDLDEGMTTICRDSGLQTMLMDAVYLAFRDCSFQLVVSDGLLEHFRNPLQIINEEARVSSRWVLNLVPKDSRLNAVLERVQLVPKEYRYGHMVWRRMHLQAFSNVSITELKRLYAIRCEK